MSNFRSRMQNGVLFVLVAVLVLAIVRIYEAKLAQAPHNLKGNIAIEGGMTANAPAAATP